ncbi:MAG TPA: flavin reductase family protein [Acidimicrobiales bacterium]|jgi:3-hydroxy-9,10-secoandrosta-1,3,5(10)-triene-9,17-dione monooxygenase reductase component|nr:flavin reductase family protein [Acidimicrobiales bacterium]
MAGAVEDPLGPEAPVGATFDEARFRSVLGHFATGVTVVAGVDGGEPLGLSVNSFTSVSLDPPLVAFCAARSSSTWPRLRSVGAFTVNVLAQHQEYLSRRFAARDRDKFRGLRWWAAPSGAPVIDEVLAWIDCTLEAEYGAGDHMIVVGRVQELDVAVEGRPLIFYRGGYGRFEP